MGGFGIPDLTGLPDQVGGTPGERLASEYLLPELRKQLMVRLVGQQSGHPVGFVPCQLPINGSLAVPTHTDALEGGDGFQPPLKGGIQVQGESLLLNFHRLRACLIKLTFPEAQCSVFRLSTR